MLNKGKTRREIIAAKPDSKWVLLNNSVYDISQFNYHPGRKLQIYLKAEILLLKIVLEGKLAGFFLGGIQ